MTGAGSKSWVAAVPLIVGAALTAPAAAASLDADLILSHAQIDTPSGWAAAMAVKQGVIIAIGTEAEAPRYRGAKTQVLDLQGAAVLPGLHDMHVHPLQAGRTQLQCMFPQGSPLSAVQTALKKCASTRAKGE